jgi:hypothetical protein
MFGVKNTEKVVRQNESKVVSEIVLHSRIRVKGVFKDMSCSYQNAAQFITNPQR